MEIATLIAAINAAVRIAELVTDPKTAESIRQTWDKMQQAIGQIDEPALRTFLANTLEICRAHATPREQAAAALNPAMRRAAALVLICMVLPMLGSSCSRLGSVHRLPETETTRPGYAVTWPADASTDPHDYATVEIDGHMVTTTPRSDAHD